MAGAGESVRVAEVADEGAAERDRQHLQTSADTEEEDDADHGSRADQRHLVVVPRTVDIERRGRVAAGEPLGVDVAAARQQQGVDEVEQVDCPAGRKYHRAAPAAAIRSAYARGVPVTSSSKCGRGTT